MDIRHFPTTSCVCPSNKRMLFSPSVQTLISGQFRGGTRRIVCARALGYLSVGKHVVHTYVLVTTQGEIKEHETRHVQKNEWWTSTKIVRRSPGWTEIKGGVKVVTSLKCRLCSKYKDVRTFLTNGRTK